MPFAVKIIDGVFIGSAAALLIYDAPTVAFLVMVIATIGKW